MKQDILIVIPARGGSKGIPRKNLRSLSGKPLIYYSIRTALESKFKPHVYVSTDDEEIGELSKKLGAKVVIRDAKHAEDSTTLDPVIYHCYKTAMERTNIDFDMVVTLQPTSPLLKTTTLDAALTRFIGDDNIDTLISAKDDTHLTWNKQGDTFIPNYKKRVNRQFLPPTYKETGGILISHTSQISERNRIGTNVDLLLLSGGEEIDIDTYEDWNICEYYIKRKKILFVVSGHNEIGLGHVYNTLLIANDILDHQVEFLVDKKSELALQKISLKNYKVSKQSHDNLIDDIREINPDVVVNDILDTGRNYIESLKKLKIKVINFEDLGEGAKAADLVINAIYPENEILPNHYFGHRYFTLRDEFLLTPPLKSAKNKVSNVLLTFGGVDPNNYTNKVLSAIYAYCQEQDITIDVVTGFGYDKFDSLESFSGIRVHRNTQMISDHMKNADLAFTSAGRTTYEVASMRLPSIVLAQNQREQTHFFASAEQGFLNLGLGINLSNNDILEAFKRIVESPDTREHMQSLMGKTDLKRGRNRTLKLIYKTLET